MCFVSCLNKAGNRINYTLLSLVGKISLELAEFLAQANSSANMPSSFSPLPITFLRFMTTRTALSVSIEMKTIPDYVQLERIFSHKYVLLN